MKMMIDIETLSTNNDAAVISIGIAKFDDTQILHTQGWALDMRKVTGHIDPGTVKWWMDQNEAARAYSFNGKSGPDAVASELRQAMENVTELWANDPDFDVIILKNWFERTTTGRWPVSFRSNRSMRTIMQLAKEARLNLDGSWANGTVAHNPVDDASNQARAVIAARKGLLFPVPVSRGWVPETAREAGFPPATIQR